MQKSYVGFYKSCKKALFHNKYFSYVNKKNVFINFIRYHLDELGGFISQSRFMFSEKKNKKNTEEFLSITNSFEAKIDECERNDISLTKSTSSPNNNLLLELY